MTGLDVFLPALLWAADATPDVAEASRRSGLHPIDWALIFLYAVSTIGLGWYYNRRQRTTGEYFIGSGRMNPLLIGVSLFATLLSSISYLAVPGESLGKGPIVLTNVLSLPLVYVVVAYVLLPVFMRQRVTSAYELLETNLGIGVRLLGAIMFIILRLVWMSLLIYLSAMAMLVMLDLDERWIPLIVLITGFVAVVYVSLGGFRAVVVTDVVQTVLLFGGALLVIATVTIHFGGFDWFPTTWQANWDAQPLFSRDPGTRVTFVGTLLAMFTFHVCTAGGDQVSIQRFMATGDVKAARRAVATQLVVTALVSITLVLVGFALLGYYQAHSAELPAGMDLRADADKVFPRYIAYHLPVGVSGLVVAAIFAAAMSSMDSGVNSVTAVVMTDFLDRFGLRPATEKGHVRIAQSLAFGIGAVVVVGSSLMKRVPGNFFAMTQKTDGLLTAPIFALFFFALFVPFARPAAVLLGTACGIATAVLVAFSGPIFGTDPETGLDPVSFQWIAPAALVVNIVVGLLVSLLWPASAPRTPGPNDDDDASSE